MPTPITFKDPDSESVSAINTWNNGSEGNYWNNYNGTDTNGDGIGETSYTIDPKNSDNYPIIAPINIFDAGIWEWTPYSVLVLSNSTVSAFSFVPENTMIQFEVVGETGTTGFCNVTIPKNLLSAEDNWTILADGNTITPTINQDTRNTYLYFTYNHSTKTVQITGTHSIPEFRSWTPLLVMLLTAMAVAVNYKRKLQKREKK